MTDETELLARLFMDVKGNKKKREDWITIAERCNELAQKSKSTTNAAKKLGISYELFRAILSLLKLPKDIQKLIKNREILFDAAQRINRIKDPQRQKEVAKMIVGLKSHDQREIIQFAKRFPKASLTSFKKRVIQPININEIHVVIIPLEKEIFNVVDAARKKRKITLEKILVDIVEQWADKQK